MASFPGHPSLDPQTNAEYEPDVQERHADLLRAEPGQISWRIEMVPSEWANDGEFYECGLGTPANARASLLELLRRMDGWIETQERAARNLVEASDHLASVGPTPEQIAEKERAEWAQMPYAKRLRQRSQIGDAMDRHSEENRAVARGSVMVRVDGEQVALEPRSYNALEILDVTEPLRHMTSESYELHVIDRSMGYPKAVRFRRGVPIHDQEFVSVLQIGQMD